MNLDEALRMRLLEISNLQVYPMALPHSVSLPALVYQNISNVPDYYLSGDFSNRTKFQVTIWAKHISQLKKVFKAVDGSLSGYRGLIGDLSVSILRINSFDLLEPKSDTFRTISDYLIIQD